MTDIKRGTVILITAGDSEITTPIKDGIMAGRAARLEAAQIETVEAEIDRQAIAEGMNRRSVNKALLRVAVGNHKTAEDYRQMRFDAEVAYGESVYEPTPMQQLKEKALIVYAMFVEAVATAYRAQDRVLEKRI